MSAPSTRFADAARAALEGVRDVPVWLDTPDRPARRAALDGDLVVDLAIVGGGLTGLWGAVLAAQAAPARSVALLEGGDVAWAASGRNGGFCSSSLTHGLANGLSRWPDEMPTLLAMGEENLDAIEATVAEHGIACDFRRSGELTVAVEPWQVAELGALAEAARGLGEKVELLGAEETRALVDSPTYLGSLHDPRSTAIVDPARLVWGLADVAERLGVTLHERTRVVGMHDEGDRVRLDTTSGRVRARQVLLGTNTFPSPLHRLRPYVVPVWDHVLATEPLTADRLAAIGWAGRQGIGDAGNQFHYYRLTADDRLVFGGYDALYYFGSDLASRRRRSPATEQLLTEHLLETFPQLEGVRIGHTWGGAIDTCTRFTAFWAQAMGEKVAAVQGYTGLGVGASRFGAQVALDLLDGADTPRTRLEMVRRKPVPFPPEPFRWAGIQLTRRSIARADATQGRRDVWLRTLDRLGLGFDS
ncbi:FAD-binding oxidoreductase [Kineosporia sp. A_224]|uniref:NAD(P)/FAD-dependent oxidoreductase n=1 Tax=Kineosporia sp. A_224 TaxID=1962180 RepID=UPI000B4BB2EB|nr:FAD-dependent oxidoreductase [Kineosporia sp. A_224]